MIKHLTPRNKKELLEAFSEINWRNRLNNELDSYIGNYFHHLKDIHDREELLYFLLDGSVKFRSLSWGNIHNKLVYKFRKDKEFYKLMGFSNHDFDCKYLKHNHYLFEKLRDMFHHVIEIFGEKQFGNTERGELALTEILDEIIIGVFYSFYLLCISLLLDDFKDNFAHLFIKI